jgi:hypothetical protein
MPTIESYRFGEIVIDGRTYTDDLLILPDGQILDNWWRDEGHRLQPQDLEVVVEAEVIRLVIGTGNSGRMQVPEATRAYLREQGIDAQVARTEAACEAYNARADQDQGVAAALHLTC